MPRAVRQLASERLWRPIGRHARVYTPDRPVLEPSEADGGDGGVAAGRAKRWPVTVTVTVVWPRPSEAMAGGQEPSEARATPGWTRPEARGPQDRSARAEDSRTQPPHRR